MPTHRWVRAQRFYQKLSYHRVTARCVLSVVILPTATQQYRNYLYDKSWPNWWYEVGGLVGGNVSWTMCKPTTVVNTSFTNGVLLREMHVCTFIAVQVRSLSQSVAPSQRAPGGGRQECCLHVLRLRKRRNKLKGINHRNWTCSPQQNI